MGAFEFLALDEKGKDRKGVLEGDNARQVRQQLREKRWTPIQVDEVSARSSRKGEKAPRTSFARGISSNDLSLVTRQLSTLVKSALPLEEALQTVSKQTERARVKSLLMAVRSRVLEGHSLAQGLADFPNVFSDYYRATVAAGEQSGRIDVVLERLADYVESRQELRDHVREAMLYPLILVSLAILIVGFLLSYVVPKVIDVFSDTGQELPILTRMLISISDFVQNYGIVFVIAVVAVIVFVVRMLRHDGPRRRYHILLLKTPMIASLVRTLNTARFARTFSILVASGVDVLEALKISSDVMSNIPMKEAITDATARVREGTSIQMALQASGYFPPLMLHLIASGEASGQLEEMLDRAAAHQEREIRMRIGTLKTVMEPMFLLIVAGIVFVIMMGILMPIFEMNQLVK